MPQKQKTDDKKPQKSWASLIERYNKITGAYADALPMEAMYAAFGRAWNGLADFAPIQNTRVKAINSLPCGYTKEEIGEFLRTPYDNEEELRQVSEILRFTNYPYFKITKAYADIPTYRHYVKPIYAEKTDSNEFLREERLLDKFNKTLGIEKNAHRIVGQAVTQGKVFYAMRGSVDKTHNKTNYAMLQQLPEDWCTIIGENNVSGRTVSFNMMYFAEVGTSTAQFGDLFDPYLDDFSKMFEEPERKGRGIVYASHDTVEVKGMRMNYFPERINPDGFGNPRTFMQNGRYMYWVTLPVEKVWCFEIDDTNPAVVSPLSGLMLTYAQQADFEGAQLSNVINPLLMFITAEIPFFDNSGTKEDDDYRVSEGGRRLFETYFSNMLAANNTSGVGFFSAPFQNIKSHTFPESANANEIAQKYSIYAAGKSGLGGIMPVSEDVKASQVDASEKLESRYTDVIYRQFERMMNTFYQSLNLKYDWEFVMFGTIYNEDKIRENAHKAIANGDISAHYILSALDGESILDKLSMMRRIKESKLLDMLIPPITSYTMKQDTNGGLPPQAEGGRPSVDIGDVMDGKAGESTEDQKDAYGGNL